MELRGLRVLGFAFREITDESQKSAENNLIFSGFCGMIDPPRSEVKKAIKDAIYAGIKIKIITNRQMESNSIRLPSLSDLGFSCSAKPLGR